MNAAGTASLGTGRVIIDGTTNNIIGGTAIGAGNAIVGNGQSAIEIRGATATLNRVEGNFIGTNAAGTAQIPGFPTNAGVVIDGAPSNLVGGAATGARNLISGNNQ